MAKKKSSKKTAPQNTFSHSPFKNLKGLSAFELDKAEPTKDSPQSVEGKAPLPEAATGQTSFVEEMDFLGVKPLPERDKELPVIDDASGVQPPAPSRLERDNEEFFSAIGAMDKVFKDEWPEDSPPKALPRRMKQVEKGQLKPQAELDLHGLTVAEATSRVGFFLQNSIYQGYDVVLVITGKGLHSDGGPVLRQAVEDVLTSCREKVVEWGLAPGRYGGSGALVVFLRK